MKIAIIGIGFVGKAVARAFENNELLLIDPKLGVDIAEVKNFEPEVTFICTPTPSRDDGSVDESITVNAAQYVLLNTFSTVVIKSTVPPRVAAHYHKNYRVVFNPEFLTERNAIQDMIWHPKVILGGDPEHTKKIEELYRNHSICGAKVFEHVSAEEACWIKYITNCMLAVKVGFLNELNSEFSDKQSWSRVVNILKDDSRLGDSHWLVPGLDGKRGFGGACLPKDTKALLHEAPSLSILKTVIESNNYYRGLYEPDAREIQQNIKFKE